MIFREVTLQNCFTICRKNNTSNMMVVSPMRIFRLNVRTYKDYSSGSKYPYKYTNVDLKNEEIKEYFIKEFIPFFHKIFPDKYYNLDSDYYPHLTVCDAQYLMDCVGLSGKNICFDDEVKK